MPLLDCLRIYDQAMADFVGGFAVEGRSVATIFATPDRPFAEVVQEISNSSEEFRSQMMETNLIASVMRLDPQYNPKLRVDTDFGQLLSQPINPEGDILASKHPRPYILPYQLDLRARSRTDANLWLQWVYFKFNPYHCFYPDFGVLWGGPKQIQTILRAIRDTTVVETQEEERWIRWTVLVDILNAWMFPITDNTDDIPDPFGMFKLYKVVKKVVVETYLSPDNPPNPLSPSAELVDTVVRAEIDGSANVAVESN